jgi:uncharacterized protein YndB with AHSA1/START domain
MTQPRRPNTMDNEIIIECDLEQRPELVWEALTDPDLVAEWLGPNTLRPDMSTLFTVQLKPGEGGPVTCRVLEAIPCERLSYSWACPGTASEEPLDTVVTFELARTPSNGTHLQVTHDRPGARLSPPPVTMMVAGRDLTQIRPHRRMSGRVVPSRAGGSVHQPLQISTVIRRAA